MTRDDHETAGPADEALAASARAGETAAFAELWRRHAGAGAVAARQFAHIADADDLLSEASTRIFAAMRRGGGPHGAFRPYLYRAIRNVALDWRRPASVALEDVPHDELALPGPELAAVERTIGFTAFRSLPERWQSVLWYLDVEGMEPAQAAPLLGLSPNATSALAVRAREGLKKAWLQAHVNDHGVPEGCRWTTTRMGEFARGGLSRRGRERFEEHLETCERCSALVLEVRDAGGRLAALLLPVLLGGGAATILARRDARSESNGSSAAGATGTVVAVAAAAVVSAIVVSGLAFAISTAGEQGSGDPIAGPPTSPSEPPHPGPTPEPTPEPSPIAPDATTFSPRAAPPALPTPVEPEQPPPLPPTAPVAPVVDFDPATGRLAAVGAGDIPGAVIELWGTTTSLVTGLTSGPTLITSTVVAPDGTWATPYAGGMTPVNITVIVRQVRDGLASTPVELVTDAIFGAETVATAATVVGGDASWQLLGWPGAAWEVRDSVGTPVASGIFDAAGTATATVSLPSVPSGTVLAYDYGYVQDGAMAATPGLTATVP